MPKPTVEARRTQHDGEIAAIRKLILQGMKLVVSTQRELRQLAAEQRITERKLRDLLDGLGRGGQGNGKPRGHGDIQ